MVFVHSRTFGPGNRRERDAAVHKSPVLCEQISPGDPTQRVHKEDAVLHRRRPEVRTLFLRSARRKRTGQKIIGMLLHHQIEPIGRLRHLPQ